MGWIRYTETRLYRTKPPEEKTPAWQLVVGVILWILIIKGLLG